MEGLRRLRRLEAGKPERSLGTWERHRGADVHAHTHTYTHSLQKPSLGCAGSSSSQDTIICKCLSLITSSLLRRQGGPGVG